MEYCLATYIYIYIVLFIVCIFHGRQGCPIRFTVIWFDDILTMYFNCYRCAIKSWWSCIQHIFFWFCFVLFCFSPSLLLYQLCVSYVKMTLYPRKFVYIYNFDSPTRPKIYTSWFNACSCIGRPLGGPYSSGALGAFVKVSGKCDQTALWIVQSVCLSVFPSVCHTFLTMFSSSYHHEIFRSYYQWQMMQKVKGRGQSPRSQKSKAKLAGWGL